LDLEGKRTHDAAERLPSEVAKASEDIPSQERRQICINWAMSADFNHHAAKELEPLAIIYRQWPATVALRVRLVSRVVRLKNKKQILIPRSHHDPATPARILILEYSG
jgi:hypothetical protein